MRFTNFLSGAITSAKLTLCQEVHTHRGKLVKPDQLDVLKTQTVPQLVSLSGVRSGGLGTAQRRQGASSHPASSPRARP